MSWLKESPVSSNDDLYSFLILDIPKLTSIILGDNSFFESHGPYLEGYIIIIDIDI